MIGGLSSLFLGPKLKDLSKSIAKITIILALLISFYEGNFEINTNIYENLTIFCSLISLFLATKKQNWHYFPLVIMATIGAMFALHAENFIYLILGLELCSIAIFLIMALEPMQRSKNSALHYFILSAFITSLIIFCISDIYVANKSIAIKQSLSNFNIAVLITGFGFKLGLIPYQAWFLRAYNTSTYAAISFFSLVPKIIIIKILVTLIPSDFYLNLLFIYGCLSLVVGNFAAISQTDTRKLLAFSSVGHFGFILIALGLQNQSVLFYLLIYSLTFLLILCCLQSMEDKNYNIIKFKGLYNENKLLSILLTAGFLSNAGIPPFIGFWAKFWIFEALFKADLILIAWVAFIGTIIGIYYTIKIISLIYFGDNINKVKISFSTYFISLLFLLTNLAQLWSS